MPETDLLLSAQAIKKSKRKTIFKYADNGGELYFAFSVGFVILAITTRGGLNVEQGFGPLTASGPVWNFLSFLSSALSLPDLFNDAHKSLLNRKIKLTIAWMTAVYLPVLLGLTGWGYYSPAADFATIDDKTSKILSYNGTFGDPNISRWMSFAFSGILLISALPQIYAVSNALKKRTFDSLVKNRHEKLEILNQAATKTEINQRFLNQKNCLLGLHEKNHVAISGAMAVDDINHCFAHYLLQKQKYKLRKNTFDALGNIIAAIAALFAGFSNTEENTHRYLIISAVLYAVATAIKLFCHKKIERDDVDLKTIFNLNPIDSLGNYFSVKDRELIPFVWTESVSASINQDVRSESSLRTVAQSPER